MTDDQQPKKTTDHFACSQCHRIVTVTGVLNEWILCVCPVCGFEAKAMIEEGNDEPLCDVG